MAMGLAACDSSSSGPGSYAGSVVSPGGAPGSALLLIQGEGLVGVRGAGGTLAWSGDVSGDPAQLKVLLVDPDPTGAMTFRLLVDDLMSPTPSFTILQLSDRENQVISAEGVQIRLQR